MTNAVDIVHWKCVSEVSKFHGDSTDPADLIEPTLVVPGNSVACIGSSALWEFLIGNATYTAFNNTNACIGVGDSTTANSSPLTMTDLQAASNYYRMTMDSTYPQHTAGGTGTTNQQIVFRSTFGTSVANYAWNEWGVFNNTTHGSGVMLNRAVQSLGTKASGSTWQLTVTLTIS